MTNQVCPTHNDLRAFSLGKLDEATESKLADHLADCTQCELTIESLDDAADTLVDDLRRELIEPVVVDSAMHELLLARIEQFGVRPSTAPSSLRRADAPTTLGNYTLYEKCGEGGMGTVYRALHSHLDRIVAVKLLAADKMQDEPAQRRFQREMQAVGKLEHPNIVHAFDAGCVDGTHFIAMQYVDGEDLSTLAKRVGPLPIGAACELIRQAALGLEHAHRHDLVHRDIKPSNLMLTFGHNATTTFSSDEYASVPIVKVLDLGLALLESASQQHELTSTGQVMGTLDYMAPEQSSDSHVVDRRADVYSLGATLYRLLCGVAPFGDERYDTMAKKLVAISTKEPTPIDERNDGIPAELAAIVHRMMAKNPDDRYASASEVEAALAPFANQNEIQKLLTPQDDHESAGSVALDSSSKSSVATTSQDNDTLSYESAPPSEAQKSAASPTKIRRRTLVIVGLAVTAAIIAFTILTLPYGDGELVIEYDEREKIELVVKQGEREVDSFELTSGGGKHKLSAGKYEIEIRGANEDQLKLSKETIELSRNNKTTLRITRRDRTSTPTDPPSSPKYDPEVERSFAEWALAHGHTISIDGSHVELRRIDDVPVSDFRVTRLSTKAGTFTDADVLRVRKLSSLKAIALNRTQLTKEGLQALSEQTTIEDFYDYGTRLEALLPYVKKLPLRKFGGSLADRKSLEALCQQHPK